ncbi:MAG TPA: peptidase S1, partial [Ktedonobacter sp.]|nr:peptidase S1 [Ktedonobacter sp.]
MTQAKTFSLQPTSHLPDAFSASLVDMFNRVQPGIVQVHTEGRGAGTGIIWDARGHIITNHHVVARDNAQVRVLLADGRMLDAKVLKSNPQLDLALLKVTAENLQPLVGADSSKLRIGEWLFAIGHPWGQRWVVTAGIMSGIIVPANNPALKYIKSDVRLAPGNSGGPLLNADGEVVGINAMIFGGDLSVSIPSSTVTTWLGELSKRTARLGIAVQ